MGLNKPATRQTLFALCSALSLLMQPGCSSAPKPPSGEGFPSYYNELGLELKLQERKLKNGLRVILIEDHTVPVVTYQSWFRVGSVDEQEGATGLAHLFEHLMFKGTEKYGPKQFFEQLEAKGAEVNAYTTRDYTVYYQSFAPPLLPKVIDMESDRLANLKLDEALLETEKQVVFEERRLRTDNSPGGRMQEALWALAYQKHPYRWPVIGTPQDLARISIDQLRAFFQKHYQPSNLVVVVGGDIDPDATFKMIEAAYSPIPGKAQPDRNPPKEPAQNGERRIVLEDFVASQRVARGYHVTSATDDDSYALDVLSNILFEGTHSRAYRRLVEEKDLVLGVTGTAFTPVYPGLFVITMTMKGKMPAAEAERELDALFKEVQDKGVTQQEIDTAVRQLTVNHVDSVRTPFGLAQLVGLVTTVLGDPNKVSDDIRKYARITADDVLRVSRKYLEPNNRTTVTLVPKKAPPHAPAPSKPSKDGRSP